MCFTLSRDMYYDSLLIDKNANECAQAINLVQHAGEMLRHCKKLIIVHRDLIGYTLTPGHNTLDYFRGVIIQLVFGKSDILV